MNTLRGLGACAVLAAVAYAVTKVVAIGPLMLGINICVVAVALVTYTASVRRRRKDRRMANGRIRSRGVTSG